jgi:hypothetical protein
MTSHLSGLIERHQRALCGQVGIARKYTKMVEIINEQAQPTPPQEVTSAPDPLPHHAAPTTVPEPNNDMAGYVYLVTCPHKLHSKIGRWSGSLAALKSRYATYYGTPSIIALWCDDAVATEKQLKITTKHAGHLKQSDRDRELVECSSAMRSFFMTLVGASNDLDETLVDIPGVFSLKRKHMT